MFLEMGQGNPVVVQLVKQKQVIIITSMQVVEYIHTILKLQNHVVVVPISIAVCAILKLPHERRLGVTARPKPNSRLTKALIILPSPSSFGTRFFSPFGPIHVFFVIRNCLKMHSSCPKIIIGFIPGGNRTLRFPPKLFEIVANFNNASLVST